MKRCLSSLVLCLVADNMVEITTENTWFPCFQVMEPMQILEYVNH